MSVKKAATVLATAAAIAFATAPVTSTIADAASGKVKCYGVNGCKGKSQCKTASSACKGHNSCKGKGYVMTKEKNCMKMGGTTTEPKATDAAATGAATDSNSSN